MGRAQANVDFITNPDPLADLVHAHTKPAPLLHERPTEEDERDEL